MVHVKLGKVWCEADACPVVCGFAGAYLWGTLPGHIVVERLLEAALSLAVTGLYHKLS